MCLTVESPRPEELREMEFRVGCGNHQLATHPPEIMNVWFSSFIFFSMFSIQDDGCQQRSRVIFSTMNSRFMVAFLSSSSMKKIKSSAQGQSCFTQSGQLIRSLDLWIT